MRSTILFSFTIFGIAKCFDRYSPIEQCVHIANNTSGRIYCKLGKNIHIEQIWLDREPCPTKLTKNSTEVTKIPKISCQNTSNCTVPFQSFGNRFLYVNIRFRCLDCLSITYGRRLQILCPRNEIIKILDVWENSIHACPAYNNTHQSNTSYVHYKCDGQHSCTIPTHNEYGILSVYFYCRVAEGNALTDKEKKRFPGGAVAGGIAGGIIILFVTFGVLLNRRKHIDCLQSKRNVPYESTTVRETNDRHYTTIELPPDTKHDTSDDGQFMGNTR
ncbi:uncharacterized protein LOC143051333 isoform X2 [Mytilus galloprovincialis]|uniref:uncharacterized protein LOC143051333 isoform X2 n=1 Tax=Mytilus galloprovincialis TaxID=29158 RepID=UPI003F7BD770